MKDNWEDHYNEALVQMVGLRRERDEATTEAAKWRELYELAFAESAAWRACPLHHFEKVWSQPQMSGRHRSEFRQAIIDAADAHDKARAERGVGQ